MKGFRTPPLPIKGHILVFCSIVHFLVGISPVFSLSFSHVAIRNFLMVFSSLLLQAFLSAIAS